ncbi:hypothetical protein C5167_022535 [Papaver somniferum]|uniref:Uncharacterized protein n=1 Tax=Papaver somniferum TaxID=3469 RepID=A0A4Y7JLW4_PAPSO|nr:hypothetical protein C5167_022535 [Papaver somniferum]
MKEEQRLWHGFRMSFRNFMVSLRLLLQYGHDLGGSLSREASYNIDYSFPVGNDLFLLEVPKSYDPSYGRESNFMCGSNSRIGKHQFEPPL